MGDEITSQTEGEVLLLERLADVFGAARVEASDVEVIEADGAVVAVIGGRARFTIGADDGLLYITVCFLNAELLGVVEIGGLVSWIASVPLSDASMN